MIVPNYWWLSRGTAMLIASILLVWSIVAGRLMNTHTNGNDLYYRLCHVQARLRHVTCKVIITWYVNDDWSYLSFPYSIWKSLWLSEFCVLGTKIQNRLTFLVTSTFLSLPRFSNLNSDKEWCPMFLSAYLLRHHCNHIIQCLLIAIYHLWFDLSVIVPISRLVIVSSFCCLHKTVCGIFYFFFAESGDMCR